MTDRYCPKCHYLIMKEGVIGQKGGGPIYWHDIKEEKITKDMIDRRDFVIDDKRKGHAISAWLCTYCGYVEFFSSPP